ncbi:uncharacterized protein APUU_70279A [Aspergillus puulaauensis]|uniref:Oxidoreductase n=1 Tax=Aspergillus puulaauensis TaxID=1220207 RepID=A0A7R7XY04_9EURO|nr:uncharacterized protein APUU_70279A [Aspergillus puulaauensis]BCS28709.1 hypothetical protein APUU_70279A [Aspergillus puulaauensis]
MVINVGIVGYGASAKSFHIPFIAAIPEYKIVAVLQRAEAPVDVSSAVPGSHCTADLPGIRHYRAPDEFFADPDTALVVVATHIDTHALFAEKALLAGKHVIVDKPFARSTAEADKVIQLAKEKGLVLTCFQNRRWDGDFQTLRKILSQNALGKIAEAEIHYDFESPFWIKYMTKTKYAPGEGHSFGLGSHSLDQAYTLFGRPKSITAFYRSQRGLESEIEDSFTVILQYEGNQKNLLVTVKSAITTPLAKQLKLFVRGSEGSFVKWQQRSTCPQEEQIARGAKPTDPGFGEEPETLRGVLTTYKEFDPSVQSYDTETEKYTGLYPTVTGRWTGLYENVADAICGRKELEVRPEQVRDVLRIIELARISHERGATVIWSDGD